jgi:hypothetical protein
MSVDHQKRFANGKVYINGIEGFWSFAKGMAKYHASVLTSFCFTSRKWNGDTITETLTHFHC